LGYKVLGREERKGGLCERVLPVVLLVGPTLHG
jgi:hypothetical protein